MRSREECIGDLKLTISRIYFPTIALSSFVLGFIAGYYVCFNLVYSALFGIVLAVIMLALVKPKIENLLMK